jgi:hypothetical protein
MIIDDDTLFYSVDDFCQSFEPWYKNQLVCNDKKKKRKRKGHLKLSEVLTILIAYHQSGMSCFKYFYQDLTLYQRCLFPKLVHDARFMVMIKRSLPALVCLLKSLMGEIRAYMFIDSTPHAVLNNRREASHKVFKDLAAKGKTSTGFFFGFKLHMLINTQGEIVRLTITPGNCDDRSPVRDMLKGIKTKLIGDKGYLSQDLFNDLFKHGTTLITKVRKNMSNRLMDMTDKLMLMKRCFIESIFSSIKSLGTLIHHRHRSAVNAFSHLIAGLVHYQLRQDKPNLNWITV